MHFTALLAFTHPVIDTKVGPVLMLSRTQNTGSLAEGTDTVKRREDGLPDKAGAVRDTLHGFQEILINFKRYNFLLLFHGLCVASLRMSLYYTQKRIKVQSGT